jgi:hypothetical protein
VIGSNTYIGIEKVSRNRLGLGLSECEKLEVTSKVRKKDLVAVVGNE